VLRLHAVKGLEDLRDLTGDACGTPHVSRSCLCWDVGSIQNTLSRFYWQAFFYVAPLQGTSHPSLLSLCDYPRCYSLC
jgi:hypothetical protein